MRARANVVRSVSDLDGDTVSEVVLSVDEPGVGSELIVLDSNSGVPIASYPGVRLHGVVDVDMDGSHEILAQRYALNPGAVPGILR